MRYWMIEEKFLPNAQVEEINVFLLENLVIYRLVNLVNWIMVL